MAFQKGHKRVGGKKKGTPNHLTTDLKNMILGALDKAGGQEYLQKQAEKNPNAFLALIGKVLPMSIVPDGNGKMTITWEK